MSDIDCCVLNDFTPKIVFGRYHPLLCGGIFDPVILTDAAEYGRVDCFKHYFEKYYHSSISWGPEPSYEIYEKAAKNGHLDCIIYWNSIMNKAKTPWYECNKGACTVAAKSGHLECLVYLHESDCPWDEKVCVHGTKKCREYYHDNGGICKHTLNNNV